ncbi:hypothetical protein E3E31_08435 [Thermococcus sp. M39]|uniref:hypothetical protein n=1 Tax=unclassified Thermococcus TaxID=2627626 RepID=UPI001439D1D2|nr:MULTISPECIES: hypothetical protein [unclassified Thermococcus]NJE08548.1 hypothetical protein [Thermococcus sp. M39]NJE13146.1 hypothetical protein [Thermococcus sp. LS2]
MRFEVLSKEDMVELSKELSKAGIMNKTKEELGWEIQHFIMIRGKYSELVAKSEDFDVIDEKLGEIQQTFERLMEKWQVGEEKEISELFDEVDINRLVVLSALIEGGYVVGEEKLKLMKKPKLDDLVIELRFPIDEVEEFLDELEEKMDAKLITEFTFMKRYYVEVLEIEKDLIQEALEIAEGYATEESLVEAMFVGMAKSVLAEIILELVKQKNKKNELIEALLEREPILIEGKREKINIYFDEEALEDILKELQSLGYIKVKGNRIWW